MRIRAIIFDIYKTVLEVGPPLPDTEQQWQLLAREALGVDPGMTLAGFTAAATEAIARDHTTARAAGIPYPEVYWPDIAAQVLPRVLQLPEPAREDFLFRQQSLFRSVRLMAGAASVLSALAARGVPLGIASNAQPYTLRELAWALANAGLKADVFTRDLCFWSFEHGFSKPDPHVFRLLSTRLRLRGIAPGETLMVGDRLDNDIVPAKTAGWRTWHLAPAQPGEEWKRLEEFIAAYT